MRHLFKRISISLVMIGLLVGLFAIQIQAQAPLTEVKMVFATGAESLAMTKVMDAYNAGRGKQDGVQVQMVLLGNQSFAERQEAIMAAQSPEVDIFYTTSDTLGRQYNALEPLTGYVTGFSEGSVFIRSTLDALSYQGTLYGLPLDVDLQFLYYRADLIDQLLSDETWQQRYQEISKAELGVELAPKPVDEWAWDDYQAAALFFTQRYNPESPTEFGTIIQAKSTVESVLLWNNVLRSNGGSWLTADGKFAFDTPEFKTAAQVYGDILTKATTPTDSLNFAYDEANQAFMNGQAAFYMQGMSAYQMINDAGSGVTGLVGIAHIPGPKPSTYITASGLALSKYSENKQAAAAWLSYLTTPEALDLYAQGGGIPPVASSLALVSDTRPELVKAAEHLEQYAYVETNAPYSFVILEVLGRNLSAYWSGQLDLDAAASNAQNEATALSSQ